MKMLVLLFVGLFSCTPKYSLTRTSQMNVLPVRQGVITYFSPFYRPARSPVEADTWMHQWADSYRAIFDLQPLAPHLDKKQILYTGKLPVKRVYDTSGECINFPPVSFDVTVNNSPDSTKIWVTNLEVLSKEGWLPIEQHRFATDKKYLAIWLTDIDVAISELVVSIKQRLGDQTVLRN